MAVNRFAALLIPPALVCAAALPLAAQEGVSAGSQGVNISFANTDLRTAVQALSQFVDRPVFFGAIGEHRVTFVSPRPVPPADVLPLLRSIVAEHGYVVEEVEGGAYRIRAAAAALGRQPGGALPQPGDPALASANGMELFVIRLRHARAADVAATVNALYGRGGALGEIGQRRSTLNDQLNANRVAPYGQEAPQVSVGGAPAGDFRGDVVIVPDPRTNTLLIRATRPDYALVQAAVEQVDVRPLQVLIEATVAYVSRDFALNYGLEASTGNVPVPGTANTTVGGATSNGTSSATDLVIRALNVGGIDLNLVLRAGESRSDVVILDRPLLLAANNEEADIIVGQQRPFVQVQRSTDGGVLDEVVQYKDVGTSLRVLPTISADGFVQLQVTQEVNSAGASAEGLDAPIISTRSIRTQLLVRDGHTAILGGLSNQQRDRTSGGIPLLSDIPLIGGIFGRNGRSDTEFELFIFITPHVIYTDDEMDEVEQTIRIRRNMRRALGKTRPLITRVPSQEEPAAPGGQDADLPALPAGAPP
jgi:type II secretory pathway component GspD/PulD (secretin)